MNLVDLIILVIFLLSALDGFRKGFISSIIGLLSSIIGFVVAIKFHPYLTDWLEVKFHLAEKIGLYLEKHLPLPVSVSEIKIGTVSTPDLDLYMDKFNLPVNIKNQLLQFIQNLSENINSAAETNMGDAVSLFLGGIILKVLAVICIWFIVDKGALLVSYLVTRLTRRTVLGTLNRLGGLFTGLLITGLTLTVVFGLISPLLQIAQQAEQSFLTAVTNTISEAQFVPYFMSAFSFFKERLLLIFVVI